MCKIGFGGGCHWCTEAVFQSLKGVLKVEQGFIAPKGERSTFSEAVIVHYDPTQIGLPDLIEIHLLTHNSTSEHSMRIKYRSAIYWFDAASETKSKLVVEDLQKGFGEKIITKVLPFGEFKSSDERFHNYYYTDPEKPFCETYISPKLTILRNRFGKKLDKGKINKCGAMP